MQYRIAKPGKLALPDTYETPEEAIAAGKAMFATRDKNDNVVGHESFVLQEIRDAELGDFIVPNNILGDIREQMSELCGDDSVLDDLLQGTETERPKLSSAIIGNWVREHLNEMADVSGVNLGGLKIVVASRAIAAE